ncbi:MAG: DUF4412 domain-containing protein [Pedobacter sp.]|nr:MAG: DUF4412 domain-containing protein [Pedobacter sp.]
MFKSIKTSVLALILISTALIAKAQKSIEQGTLTYSIQYLLTDEQKKLIDQSVLPSESKVKFNGNISKVEIDMGAATIKILSDGVAKKAVVLVDVPIMQKQYAAPMTKDDIAKQNGNLTFSDFKATGEKQTIAGYSAEKYTYKDNTGAVHELWLAPDLKLAKGAILPEFASLGGTPVKYTINQNGVNNTLTLKSVKEEKVGPFSLEIPKGYEITTMEALNSMRGGGQ